MSAGEAAQIEAAIEHEEVQEEIQRDVIRTHHTLKWIPSSIGQQIFSITSSAAGGLAGLILAYKLRDATRMNTAETLIASGLAVAASFGAIWLIRSIGE